jgi:hypothetical protein
MADSSLFHVDVIVVDGQALAFEDSSGMISGAAGFENEAKLSASGPDYTLRKRVARVLKAKLQYTGAVTPDQFAAMKDVQIALRDTVSGRKCVADGASFKSLGDVGSGVVDVEFNLLQALKWL